MPKANANSVADESHGSTRSVRAEKREGLARSIRVIATLLGLQFLTVLHARGNVASFSLPRPSRSRHLRHRSVQPLPQRDRGGHGTDDEAYQRQRAENTKRRAERDRSDNRGVRGGDAEDQHGDRQR